MGLDFPILSFMIWFPILGGIYIAAQKRTDSNVRVEASIIASICLLSSIVALVFFDASTADMQFTERFSWISVFNIEYFLGVDGISLPLIILTTFTTLLVIFAGWDVISDRPHLYLGSFLVLEGVMIGVFAALDAALFYVFWEAMLIPMFLIIGVWGGENRVYATIKFFLYTLLGSLLMLIALLYLYGETGGFSIESMHKVKLDILEQKLIFFAFLLAFAVKVPMWPVHTWLPDAHVEAPTGGSVILAAIMLKMGGYGFIRLCLPIVPDASAALTLLMVVLSLIAIVYIGFVALVQTDMKKLIAYSSISHMGFVTLGFFSVFWVQSSTGNWSDSVLGIEGAMIQMISHGFISGALFLCVGVLYDRLHSRKISDYGGVAEPMPYFASFMMLFAMANAGLPGTSGFVGEFLVILTVFKANFWVAFLAALTLILGAAYTLWMYKRVIFGPVVLESVKQLTDVNMREIFILTTLALMVLLFGLWPAPLIDIMHPSINSLVEHLSRSKI